MSNTDGMEMPCPCLICGEWFDLLDGNPSSDRNDKTVYCNKCVKEPWGDKPRHKSKRWSLKK